MGKALKHVPSEIDTDYYRPSKYEANPELVAYSVRAAGLGLTYGQLQAKEMGRFVRIRKVPEGYMKVADKIALSKR